MLKVILVLVILSSAGQPPRQATLEVPTIEDCHEQVKRFLESEYLAADGVAGLQAGCIVIKPVAEKDAKS